MWAHLNIRLEKIRLDVTEVSRIHEYLYGWEETNSQKA